jgi:glucose-6-phosphate 1-dehydrogenase
MNRQLSHRPCDLVIFGALGDLARRKLIPSLYELERAGLIEKDTRIVGVARHDLDPDGFRERMKESLDTFVAGKVETETAERLLGRLAYAKVDLKVPGEYAALRKAVDGSKRVMVNYFSVPPSVFGDICRGLEGGGFVTPETRVVLEKPIGHDLASSRAINDSVSRIFGEEQVYRIDHYLGKETVLNLVALRFANSLFMNNWDHDTIDHVQITVAEEVGIEGRWGYFDGSGQLRDMVQNHMLQILTLVAMEPPVKLEGNCIRDEKLKVLKALRPITGENVGDRVVRGQYAAGSIGGSPVPGYLGEEGSNPESTTETFVALRVDIDNWRWADVPFYLRSGKRMKGKRSEVVVSFKRVPHNIFRESFGSLPPNRLILRLQPDEGMEMEVLNKVPGIGRGVRLQNTVLDLSFSEAFQGERIADAYERLLLEAMRGEQGLFIRRDEVEQSWEWIDSIQEAWRKAGGPPLPYPAGTMGPDASTELLAGDGRRWEK